MASSTSILVAAFLVLSFAGHLKADDNSTNIEVNVTMRLIDGVYAGLKEFPYQAALLYSSTYSHDCGGVILSERIVLTAAHCIHMKTNAYSKPYRIMVGHIKRASYRRMGRTEQTSVVIDVRVHRQYNGHGLNDIAILFLETHLKFNAFVNKMRFPPSGTRLSEDMILYVSGWGRMVPGHPPQNPAPWLMKVRVPYVPRIECSKIAGALVSSQICAGGGRSGTCYGDSGGPLTAVIGRRDYVLGLVSLGDDMCKSGRPTVYTNIAPFIPWIIDEARRARIPLRI